MLPYTKKGQTEEKENHKIPLFKFTHIHSQSVIFELWLVLMLTYWSSKIGISTQLVCPVLTQAYCVTTNPACKVGQNIHLGIICLQVHNVLNIQHWGEGGMFEA